MTTLELLQDLLRINSVNPMLEANAPGEMQIAEFVRDWCDSRQLETPLLEPTKGRPSGKWQKYVSISRVERVAKSDVSDEFVTGWSDPARKVHGEDQEAILPASAASDPSPRGAGLGSRSPIGAGLAARRCMVRIKKRSGNRWRT
jgi:acetylornithine deacetylase/succinyl-diaminopimelate desuccinylase-like protein